MNCSTPGFPLLHCLPEFAQTRVYWISNAIQPSHPLSPQQFHSRAYIWKKLTEKETLTPMFIAALFTIGKIWKQSKCPKDEWLKKMVCVCVLHIQWNTVMVVVIYSLSHVQLCNPMDSSPLDSSVHGIPPARILERVANSFSRGSSWPRNQSCFSCIGRWILYCWAAGKPTVKYCCCGGCCCC